MATRLLSLENISLVKSAVLLSLFPELKKEILCIPGSEYDVCKSRYQYYRKEQWNAIVERKAKEIIRHKKLPENLEQKVLSILPAVALRMLIWAEYHEGTLGLTRYYSLNFLNFSHFTMQGVINNKKAAEDMIKDENLGIKQKYKLACIYCFPHDISFFFKQIVGDKKNFVFGPEDFKWMETPEIVKFWSFRLIGVVDEYNNTPRNRYRLQTAIKSGSTEAVKFSWERAGILPLECAHIHAVTEILNKKSIKRDWIVFRDRRYDDDSEESWVPNYYSVEILCFFLSNMTESQQRKALATNITGNETDECITVLEFFLSWPYQDYFMEIASVLWNLMPQKTYAAILLQICDKIEPTKSKNLLYGEERSYDYKKLLKDFWSQSPDHFKRYVFKNSPVAIFKNDWIRGVVTTTGIDLLLKLLSFKKFTYEDEEIIWLILGSATNEEKEYLTSAELWRSTCISILKEEKFEIFDRLLLVFCKSEEKISEFKKNMGFNEEARGIFFHFLSYGKLNGIKSLINRLSLSEEQLLSVKEDIIFSGGGLEMSRKLLLSRRYEDFEEFIKWFLPCTETAIEFKRWLSSRLKENSPRHRFNPMGAPEFITRFTRSKLPNREVIKEIQTGVADIFGREICEDLLTSSSLRVIYEENDSSVKVENEFRGGQWKKVDDFLTFCLSTKKEILEFKKTFYKLAGDDIHSSFIKGKQWKEAKRFFDWLELSEEEIKDLKERALFENTAIRWLLHHLVFEQDAEMYNLDAVDLLLRWHLTDKETVIEFRDDFFYSHEGFDEAGLRKFNSLIENYLDDLDQEEICQTCGNAEERFFRYLDGGGGKRKSSVFSQQKKLRLTPSGEENKKTGNSTSKNLRDF